MAMPEALAKPKTLRAQAIELTQILNLTETAT
jgi:hypothetical protein